MTKPPDPDKTQEIDTPKASHSGAPPRPSAPETPWWQNVNQEVPPIPAPSARSSTLPPPTPRRALAAPRRDRGSVQRREAPPGSRLPRSADMPPRQASGLALPAPNSTEGSVRNAPRRRLLIRLGIGLVVMEAFVLAAVLLRLRTPDAPVLDVTKAQRGVEQILTDPKDGYGVKTVTDVVCNNGTNPPIRKGEGFECDVVVDGTPRRVAVVFQDYAGTYAVDRPR